MTSSEHSDTGLCFCPNTSVFLLLIIILPMLHIQFIHQTPLLSSLSTYSTAK